MIPWHEGTALCLADVVWHDGSEVVASPRQILRRQLRPSRRARLDRARRHRARVHRLPRQLRAGAEEGLPVAGARQPLQRRLLVAWDRARRALDPAHPATACSSRGWRSRTPRASCNLGQHEINFHYTDALLTADHHAIYKNGAKEIAADTGDGDHVHGEVQRARGQLLPHPLLAGRCRRPAVRARAGGLRRIPGRPARDAARADADAGAERELLQALRPGVVRADGDRVGARQPHVCPARGRARPVTALREPLRRRPTSTPTSRSRR